MNTPTNNEADTRTCKNGHTMTGIGFDECHLDFHTFGHAIDEEMLKYYHDENHKKIDFKLPKF